MNGQIGKLIGRFPQASNATYLAESSDGEVVVYKPEKGERPLWDFSPGTLSNREVLAFEISQVMGLDIVPQTVLGEGPFGPGTIQKYVPQDSESDPIHLLQSRLTSLWPIALFDMVCNNADRKLGHILQEQGTGRLWAIDHGLILHPDPKLRTILWGLAGQGVPDDLLTAVDTLISSTTIGSTITESLGLLEYEAFSARCHQIIADPVHPPPPTDRPPIPWPAY